MAAVILQIADAVEAALNGASLSQSFTVSRQFVPVHQLDELDTLTLTVVPASTASKLITRGARNLFEHTVSVGAQKVIGSGTLANDQVNALVDPLVRFTEEVANLFDGLPQSLSGGGTAQCTGAEIKPVYDPKSLDEMRLFVSVVTLTYQVR